MRNLFVIIATLMLASCGATSGDFTANKQKVRAIELFYSTTSSQYLAIDSTVYVRWVDSAYRVGDMVDLAGKQYRIVE